MSYLAKMSRPELIEKCKRDDIERDVYAIALIDMCRDQVKWFGKRPTRIGICRPAGPSGGIVIVDHDNCIMAYLWEDYGQKAIDNLNQSLSSPIDLNMADQYMKRRRLLTEAQAYIIEEQKKK